MRDGAISIILEKLAEALGVTFSQLMAPAIEREIVHIPAARQPILRDEQSGFQRRCLSPVLPGRGVDWVLNTLPPGTETGNFVAHRRGVEEYIYVLKGRLRAMIGDDQVMLNKGDSLYFQADASHSFSNVGKGDCQYFSDHQHGEGLINPVDGGNFPPIGLSVFQRSRAAVKTAIREIHL